MVTEEFKRLCGEFAEVAKAKKYDQELRQIIAMLACSKNAHNSFGSLEIALEKVIEICKQCDDEEKLLSEVLELIGIDEDALLDEER